jgi:hypothetical protein
VTSKSLFDRRYGEGAFARLRSRLDDPELTYQHIANKFGLTKQYIAQLANELGINGRRRQRERERMRMLSREPCIIKLEYPPDVQAVIRHSGDTIYLSCAAKFPIFGSQVANYGACKWQALHSPIPKES